MPQVWLHDVSVSLGGPLLLDRTTLSVEKGERIGLLGRNGTGKSTLLKMLNGEIRPDSGEIVTSAGLRVSLLPQEVPDSLPGTVRDIVASGGQEHLDLLRQYHDLTVKLARRSDASSLKELEQVQHRLETSGAWDLHQRVETVIRWTNVDQDADFGLLSAGSKRRVLLARALAAEPDLLLLDEPTNHLDIDSIVWLEEFLLRFNKTLLFVTHDRSFLQRVATRIVELDRGRLSSFDCDYDTYLTRRQAVWDAEEKADREFDRKLTKEEEWIRRGIRARRTRNEGRVRALERLRAERAHRRERMANARMVIAEANRSGRLVVEAEKVSFAFEGRKIFEKLSTAIIRGDRVGILGPNGSGKTTLLKVLLGELEPQEGRLRVGAGLKIAYFDQLRGQLDENRTVKDNIADGGETVSVGGRTRNVIGYLRDFLFLPEQILAPARLLSGGERNRLLLAKLFCVPSNVLVLDEPTNDLDMETLSLLEEQLLDYGGTILLVSHDRAFLDNVVTSTLVFEGNARLKEYVGGYGDWLRQRREPATATQPGAARKAGRPAEEGPRSRRRLSFKEGKELETLPRRIESLEEEVAEIAAVLSSSEFYSTGEPGRAASFNARLRALELEIEEAYARWQELEDVARATGAV